jgi:hypothetical protein
MTQINQQIQSSMAFRRIALALGAFRLTVWESLRSRQIAPEPKMHHPLARLHYRSGAEEGEEVCARCTTAP